MPYVKFYNFRTFDTNHNDRISIEEFNAKIDEILSEFNTGDDPVYLSKGQGLFEDGVDEIAKYKANNHLPFDSIFSGSSLRDIEGIKVELWRQAGGDTVSEHIDTLIEQGSADKMAGEISLYDAIDAKVQWMVIDQADKNRAKWKRLKGEL